MTAALPSDSIAMMHVSFLRRFAVAVFALFVAASAGRAFAADATGISGVVHSASGAAVPGAVITARGPVRASAVTAADGSFTIAVGPGIYQISVSQT